MAEREERVTPLELFFDLVFVFGITQVTALMSNDTTGAGIGRGLLVLAALWWAWAAYAWLTNTLDPDEGAVRLSMMAAMGAILLVGLAVPRAFGDEALLFSLSYLAVRVLHIVLYMLGGRQNRDLLGAVLRMLPTSVLGPLLIVVASFLDGSSQAVLWIVALLMDYLGVLIGRGQGWEVHPVHFAERHHLIVIIALGESIIAIGIGATAGGLGAGVVSGALVGIMIIAALWWTYFDVLALYAQRILAHVSGVERATLARDYYSYLHLPMIAGIVLFALGLKKTLEHVDEPLTTIPALALCGGLSLYFLSHVLQRVRVVPIVRRTTDPRLPWIGPGRAIAFVACLALFPVSLNVSAMASLLSLAAICFALITWDVVHYREERAVVRTTSTAMPEDI